MNNSQDKGEGSVMLPGVARKVHDWVTNQDYNIRSVATVPALVLKIEHRHNTFVWE